MATRDAVYRPHLDLVDVATLADKYPAQTSLLADISDRHHALMTAWGNPPLCRSVYLRATSMTSWTVPLRVPPGVTEMDFGLLLWGIGSVTCTASTDATGFTVYSSADIDPDAAAWVWTSGAVDSSAGATSGRALTVAASVGWTYTSLDITLTIDDITSECGVAAIVTAPVWRRVTL